MGMFSAAVGAGAGAVASQAQGLIDAETRVDAEKSLLAAREQMEMRLREAQEQTRRSGNAYDFAQAGAQQSEVLKRADAAARSKAVTDYETSAGTEDAKLTDAERRLRERGRAREADPKLREYEQADVDAKESTGMKALHKSQARQAGAHADLYAAGGGKGGAADRDARDTRLTILDLKDQHKMALDVGNTARAEKIALEIERISSGHEDRRAAGGKGGAARPAPTEDDLNVTYAAVARAKGDAKKLAAIRQRFEDAYGPGSYAPAIGN